LPSFYLHFWPRQEQKKHLGKWGVRINIAEFLPLFLRLGTNEKSLVKSER